MEKSIDKNFGLLSRIIRSKAGIMRLKEKTSISTIKNNPNIKNKK
jgi:hypothetical protein